MGLHQLFPCCYTHTSVFSYLFFNRWRELWFCCWVHCDNSLQCCIIKKKKEFERSDDEESQIFDYFFLHHMQIGTVQNNTTIGFIFTMVLGFVVYSSFFETLERVRNHSPNPSPNLMTLFSTYLILLILPFSIPVSIWVFEFLI